MVKPAICRKTCLLGKKNTLNTCICITTRILTTILISNVFQDTQITGNVCLSHCLWSTTGVFNSFERFFFKFQLHKVCTNPRIMYHCRHPVYNIVELTVGAPVLFSTMLCRCLNLQLKNNSLCRKQENHSFT